MSMSGEKWAHMRHWKKNKKQSFELKIHIDVLFSLIFLQGCLTCCLEGYSEIHKSNDKDLFKC